ncbi:MAG: aminotransferase class I/II-fold pyridoxal phosphate-dependent enzyme [Oscillospiraceae bacterium]|nr:aminotransferase class I/II-fold pyridoxal phosphate-dependent enzyme [Oscillospiraceae bacterium]
MLDFSANINPLGMPESVRHAIIQSASDCICYPDPYCTKLTAGLAGYENISASRIVCGNGAADLIFRIVYAFAPERALIPAPSFSEYGAALKETGCFIQEYPLHLKEDTMLDEGFLSAIREDTDIVFLCTPNNPTGQRIPPGMLKNIAEKCRSTNTILVCDECFLQFTEQWEEYSLRKCLYENIIVLNAFTKLYAIPGLRLGYALCGSEQIADRLRKTGQFWSVSVPAQNAGIAALEETGWIEKTVQYVRAERRYLSDALRDAGLTVYDGTANFLLIQAPSDFGDVMEQKCILVRRCMDFHYLTPEHFRIAVRTHEENRAFIAAVKEVYSWQKQL